MWLATSHTESLGLTGIGSSASELGAGEEAAAVGANARADDIVVEKCSSSSKRSERESTEEELVNGN